MHEVKAANLLGLPDPGALRDWDWSGSPDRDRHGDPAAGGDGPPRRGPGPAAGRLREQRDPILRTLLNGLDLKNPVVTADALYAQRDRGAQLTGRGAHHRAGSNTVSQARRSDGRPTMLKGRGR
jgi:hypothetical protein